MIIYFLLLIFCLLLSCLKLSRQTENVALAIITVFLCFGYTTGTDWFSYEIFYYDRDLANHLRESREIGYYLFQTLFYRLGVSFWTFHIGVKVIVFLLLVRFVRLFEVNIFLFLVFFLPTAGFYLFIDCPFRNLIAFGISLIAVEKLIHKKNIQFFLLVLLAMSFHTSAIIMLLVYILFNAKISSRTWVIVVVTSFILAFRMDFIIENVFVPLSNAIPAIEERLLPYFLDYSFRGELGFGLIVRLLSFGMLITWRKKIQQHFGGNEFIFNMVFLFFVLFPWGMSMKILQRFYLYLIPAFIIGTLFLLRSLKRDWKWYFIYAFFVLFGFVQTLNLVTHDHRYVPYTNYLFFDRSKDIETRRQHNIRLSPYTRE